MAKPGATRQPCSAAQHSPQMSIQIFEFQNIFFGPCVGGRYTCLTPPQNFGIKEMVLKNGGNRHSSGMHQFAGSGFAACDNRRIGSNTVFAGKYGRGKTPTCKT